MKKAYIIPESDFNILTQQGVVLFSGYLLNGKEIYYADLSNSISYPTDFVFQDKPSDLKGILPPEQIMTGQPYFFLKDMKDLGSYRELKKDEKGTEFEVNSKQVNDYLQLRSYVTQSPIELWATIEELCNQCNTSNNPNAYLGLKYLFVEADAAILNEIVPSGIRLSDGTLQFRDWTVNGDSAQPFSTSLDESKVILRCALGGESVLTDELLTWIAYRDSSTLNIKLLCHFEYQDLMNTVEYNNE